MNHQRNIKKICPFLFTLSAPERKYSHTNSAHFHPSQNVIPIYGNSTGSAQQLSAAPASEWHRQLPVTQCQHSAARRWHHMSHKIITITCSVQTIVPNKITPTEKVRLPKIPFIDYENKFDRRAGLYDIVH